MRSLIESAKIAGLLALLERDHVVRFKNGAQIEYEDCSACRGEGEVPDLDYPGQDPAEASKRKRCERCGGEKVRLLVTRGYGGGERYRLDESGEVQRAYLLALNGPPRKAQPRSRTDFGDDPPF